MRRIVALRTVPKCSSGRILAAAIKSILFAGLPTTPNILIINSNSGVAVEVPGFSITNGTQLDTWSENGGTNQQWLLGNKQ